MFDECTKIPISWGVVVINSDVANRTFIDTSGYFSISVAPGTYELKFGSPGNFDLITDSIRIKQNSQISLRVFLGCTMTRCY